MGEVRFSEVTFEALCSFPGPTRAQWREAAVASLRGKPLGALEAAIFEGIDVAPLYAEDDAPAVSPWPGVAPFTRGWRAAVAAGGWETAELVDEPEIEAAAALLAEGATRGAESVRLRVARADDDEAPSGVVLGSADDAERLLAATDPPPKLHLDAGASAPAIHALFAAAAEHRGLGPFAGSVGFDPLAGLALEGGPTTELASGFELAADLVAALESEGGVARALAVDLVGYQRAGASAVDELGLCLASGAELLRRLEARGVGVERTARQLVLGVAIGRDLFVEVAKLRALRRLWSELLAACGVEGRARATPIHAITSSRSLTVYDPWVNILRVTVATFAAIVGGADVIVSLPFDHPLGLPDRLGRRLACTTQAILRLEGELDRVADPAGGSYYVERLTDELARAGWARFQELEAGGGAAAALLSGALAESLGERLAARRERIVTGLDPVTGVSSYPNLDEERPSRRPRSASGAAAAARRPGALVPEAAALDGARSGSPRPRLELEREAEPFERLRAASDAYLATHGARPRVALVALGEAAARRRAVAEARNLVAAGGLEAIEIGRDRDLSRGAVEGRVFALCGPPAALAEEGPELTRRMVAYGARAVFVLGWPREGGGLGVAGAEALVGHDGDLVAGLERLHQAIGVGR